MMTFNILLKEYRLKNKISKKEAANYIGISDSYYSRLESGTKKAITSENLEKIKTLYNLKQEEFDELIALKFLPEDINIRKKICDYLKK